MAESDQCPFWPVRNRHAHVATAKHNTTNVVSLGLKQTFTLTMTATAMVRIIKTFGNVPCPSGPAFFCKKKG